MPDFIVTLDDVQVAALTYLAASARKDVVGYVQSLVSGIADSTNKDVDAKVAGLSLGNPEKEARVRAIMVEP